MAVRTAEAVWEGTLREGQGTVRVGSGSFEGAYSFPSRFEEGNGTNPEELVGAAHAGCFSMALSADLSRAGYTPTRIHTKARVHIERGDAGFSITVIELDTEAEIPGIEEEAFQQAAEGAKKNCPISKALASVDIRLTARLV